MIRRLILALSLAIATTSGFAQNRGRVIINPGPLPIAGTTVAGVVTAVNGNLISLAGGLVTIDASHASVSGTIATGSLIFAVLSSSNVAANAPLPASIIGVTDLPQATLTGPVQSIDLVARTLTVLGRTIRVTAETSFGGGHSVHGLADIVPNDNVEVQANAAGGSLVASSILVFAPVVQPPTVIHGTVKTIGTSSWIITDAHNRDVTVVVNAQTKIVGAPKVGDTVDVLVSVDSANNYVAISIIGSIVPPEGMHLSGVVKSIGTTTWVIGPERGLGPDFLVQVNAQTKITGDPHVGDHVDVIVQTGAAGFVAISITKV
jgi:hypothetical protein